MGWKGRSRFSTATLLELQGKAAQAIELARELRSQAEKAKLVAEGSQVSGAPETGVLPNLRPHREDMRWECRTSLGA